MNNLDDHAVASPQPLVEPFFGAEPVVNKKDRMSVVWLVPLVAAVVAAWLVYKTLSERGPSITITFETANGLEAGKTKIKHKDVEIGKVTAIRLSHDFSRVELSASLVKNAEKYLSAKTQFWAVRPRISLQGVSGLGTLVSGAYIEMDPRLGGQPKTQFKGLENPPLVRSGASGIQILLNADSLGSLTPGSPVYFRDIPAGEVLGYNLTEDKQGVLVHAFIKAPYHLLVHENSRFWKVSGIDVSLDAEGIRVNTPSLAALLLGGVAFDSPTMLEEVTPVASGTSFHLFYDQKDVTEVAYRKKISFIMYFSSSVRGLKTQAPVEFRGIKIGSVTDIKMEFDRKNTSFRVAVLVQVEPERVGEVGRDNGSASGSPYEVLETLVDRGLRAQLETASYLTGQIFVNLVLRPETPKVLVGQQKRFPELPTLPTNFEEISGFVTNFLSKLHTFPLKEIGLELEGTLKGLNRTVNAPEVLASIQNLNKTLTVLKSTAAKMDKQVGPMSVELTRTAQAAQKALVMTDKLAASLHEILGPDAPLSYRMVELTEEITATAKSIRAFVDVMNRKPESMVFGKGGKGK